MFRRVTWLAFIVLLLSLGPSLTWAERGGTGTDGDPDIPQVFVFRTTGASGAGQAAATQSSDRLAVLDSRDGTENAGVPVQQGWPSSVKEHLLRWLLVRTPIWVGR